MSLQTKGGCWCPRCERPVVGERTIDRSGLRGLLAILFGDGWLPPPGPYHCRFCGAPVRDEVPADSDWRTVPGKKVPAWRRRDRARLDS